MSNTTTKTDIKRFLLNTLSLQKETIYFGIMSIILVASFFSSFWWMPPHWMVENAYSPGPMATVLFGVIIFFKFKQLDKKFKIPITTIKFLGVPVLIFAGIFFFGTQHPDSFPFPEVLVPVAFCGLFLILTAMTFYTAAHVARKTNADKSTESKVWGILSSIIIALCLIVHFFATRGDLPRLSIMSYLGIVLCIILNVYGWKVTQHMLFPVLFLLFMIPWEFIDAYIGAPLRVFATSTSVGLMNMFGMGVERVGTTMSVGDMTFTVEAACSGLKSLMALTALGATFAFATQPTIGRKYFVAICAIPIAICANVLRLIGVAVSAQLFGQEFAMKFFHDNAAIILYIIATLMLFSIDKLFKVQWLKIEDW